MRRRIPPTAVENRTLPELQRSRGRCGLLFDGTRPEQQLRLLDQTPPCRVLFPRPAKAGVHEAAIITTTGGMTGGDHIAMTLTAQNDARVSVSTQAAEKIYRSTGDVAGISVTIEVDATSSLEWMPQETILFDRSRFNRKSVISLAASARLLACEMTVFGREAHGETNPHLDFSDRWRVYRDGRLVWAENYGFRGMLTDVRQSWARLNGAGAVATLVIAVPGVDGQLDDIRSLLETGEAVTAAATSFGDMVVCRIVGRRAMNVRHALMSLWLMTRRSSLDFGSRLPRVWSV
ncbi:MAG: urease accessory protein UreD [Rhodospirillales bacterium]